MVSLQANPSLLCGLQSEIRSTTAMTPPDGATGQLSEGTFGSEATWLSVPGEQPEQPETAI